MPITEELIMESDKSLEGKLRAVLKSKETCGLKTTLNVKGHFKSSFVPLDCSLVTSLVMLYLSVHMY